MTIKNVRIILDNNLYLILELKLVKKRKINKNNNKFVGFKNGASNFDK